MFHLNIFENSFVPEKTLEQMEQQQEQLEQYSSGVNENKNHSEIVNNNCFRQDCISLYSGIFL